MSTRRWAWVLVAAISVALIAGCATIPQTGTVHKVETDRTQVENAVRYNPPGPSPEASPSQIVYGYLDAMLAFPVGSDVAKQFMTDDAAKSWKRSRTVIYSQPRVESEHRGSAPAAAAGHDRQTVQLTYTAIASLGRRGRYTAGAEEDTTVTWSLVREGGEWRISDPPPGVMVTEQFFEDYYLPLNLYFFDHSAGRLVADPVYQPEGDQLATTLMMALLRGPDRLLAGEARTFLPESTGLDVSVPVDDEGVANVRLTGPIRELSGAEQERLAAQVVWTVRQAHAVSGVRISVNDTPLNIPGVGEVQATDAWDRYDPVQAKGRSQAFAMHDRRLVVISGTSVSEFSGPWGEKPSDAVDFSVDTELERIALVARGRASVQVASLSDAGESTTVATGDNFLRPVWDTRGRLWLIDRHRRSSSLTIIDGKKRHEVSLGALADAQITSFELSPDNTRFVAIARRAGRKNQSRRVFVGAVTHAPDGKSVDGLADVRDLRLADEGLTSPTSAAWRSTVGVVVLASLEGGLPQPYVARIDGSPVSGGPLTREPLLPDIGATEVVCSGVLAAPVYVADRKHRLWVQDVNGRWEEIPGDPFRSPGFPG